MEQKIGVVIAIVVFAVVALFLWFNLQPTEPPSVPPQVVNGGAPAPGTPSGRSSTGAPFREYPVGEAERNGMHIASVWLPPIQMEGMELPHSEHVIHLEADIHALEGNVNGFGEGAWVPYLTVEYVIQPLDPSKEVIKGSFMPMIAKDGPHYGATIEMPGAGKYKLTYRIDNPSKNGFGRHTDPVTGVAPWWEAFEVTFDFDYPGSNPASSSVNSKSQ